MKSGAFNQGPTKNYPGLNLASLENSSGFKQLNFKTRKPREVRSYKGSLQIYWLSLNATQVKDLGFYNLLEYVLATYDFLSIKNIGAFVQTYFIWSKMLFLKKKPTKFRNFLFFAASHQKTNEGPSLVLTFSFADS